MSDVLDDRVLAQLDMIASTLRDWRRAQFADARLINSLFDVKVSAIQSPQIATGFEKIVDLDMSRVFLMIATSIADVAVVPGSGVTERAGFHITMGNPLRLSIRDAPGLVSLDWYFGMSSVSSDLIYVVEILDKRRR
jgi:hypothetical protein